MEINEKLLKQISEMKYLNVENTERYRPIIRFFFDKYEKLEYWLYKEDIFNELKNSEYFKDYTLELCEQDLQRLVDWKSLSSMQDTSNVQTVEEFKNRRLRYQLTEYGVEIERFVLRLETLNVKTSSLEPKIFEKIRLLIQKILTLSHPSEINECFEELNYNFTSLNESYKDFLKIFHEAKTEELMKSESFISYKDTVIKYLREFISGFQINNLKVNEILKNMPEDIEEKLMEKIIIYQKSIPNMEPDFDYEYLKEINRGKWRSIIKWFKNESGLMSESARLKNAINDIINKILKNVSTILEMQASNMNRKEEYKHILTLFADIENINDAHELGTTIFGIDKVKHYTSLEKKSEFDMSVQDLECAEIILESHNRKIKIKLEKKPIQDKTLEKQRQLEEILALRKREREILEKYILKGSICMGDLKSISMFERRFLLSLITSGLEKDNFVYNGEHGVYFKVLKSEEYVSLECEDGTLEIPNFKIEFGGNDGK